MAQLLLENGGRIDDRIPEIKEVMRLDSNLTGLLVEQYKEEEREEREEQEFQAKMEARGERKMRAQTKEKEAKAEQERLKNVEVESKKAEDACADLFKQLDVDSGSGKQGSKTTVRNCTQLHADTHTQTHTRARTHKGIHTHTHND
jgi:membrane protein involved in colicin uptake